MKTIIFLLLTTTLSAQMIEGENCICSDWSVSNKFEKCLTSIPLYTGLYAVDSIIPIEFLNLPDDASLILVDSVIYSRMVYDEKSRSAMSTTYIYNNTINTIFLLYLRKKNDRNNQLRRRTCRLD